LSYAPVGITPLWNKRRALIELAVYAGRPKPASPFTDSPQDNNLNRLWISWIDESDYSTIFVTIPLPTVRPPSRIAKRTPSSIAIGLCNSTDTFTLSPGMHMSASIRFAVPVTSVVRK